MGVYYLMLIIPAFFAINYARYKRTNIRALSILIFFVFFWFLLAFRDTSVGTDIKNYESIFDTIKGLGFTELQDQNIEIGYVLLCKIIALFTSNFHVFLAIIGLITIIPIMILYTKESPMPFLTIVLFINMPVFHLSFSGLRQAIAISIGVAAYSLVKKKKLFHFLVAVALAALIHVSALVLLVMYPMYYLRLSKKAFAILIPFFLAVYIFKEKVFTLAIWFLGEKYRERYSVIEDTGSYTMIILFIAFLIFVYIMLDPKKATAETYGLRNFLLFALLIQLFAPINTTVMRMNYYFIIFLPLLIPKVLAQKKDKYTGLAHLVTALMIIFFTAYFFYDAYNGLNTLQIFPYKFLWQH